MEPEAAVILSFPVNDGDRLMRDLEARGLIVTRDRQGAVVLAGAEVRPPLAHLEMVTDVLRVSIRRPAPLKPKHAKRSSHVADHRLSAELYAAAMEVSSLPADRRAERLVALLARARAELIGTGGMKAKQLIEMRGRPARAGLPGLGRRR